MNTSFSKISVVLILSILISACSVVKRDGIYQSRKYKSKTAKTWKPKKKTPATHYDEYEAASVYLEEDDIVTTNIIGKEALQKLDNVTVNRNDFKQLLKAKSAFATNAMLFSQNEQSDSCDLLVLTNGDEIEAKVTEISSTEIRYKRCNNLTGPTVIVDKSEVLFVKYSNGEKEVFTTRNTRPQPQERVQSNQNTQSSGSPALRAVGVILLIIGILFILVVSILLGLLIAGFGLLFMAVGKR